MPRPLAEELRTAMKELTRQLEALNPQDEQYCKIVQHLDDCLRALTEAQNALRISIKSLRDELEQQKNSIEALRVF